jgi:hydrogenase maturation protein HypF
MKIKNNQVVPAEEPEACRWIVTGRVQGVGFRPFVFCLAKRFGLAGRVQNLAGQVLIEAEGEKSMLNAFGAALFTDAPPLAKPKRVCVEKIAYRRLENFEIVNSSATIAAQVHIPPDYFLCDDCRREMQTPDDRRYHYPFINCTQCGPRYSLITSLPYDRANTTMSAFELCSECQREYEDPSDRRFHKGIGGYHLMCDAGNVEAIERLRCNKHRPHKPFALMFPWRGTDGMEMVQQELECNINSRASLCDPARPIVLLPKRPDFTLPELIAPGLDEIGAMLPYSPLHHLLMDEMGKAVVATSGNVSGEPVLTENVEAEYRLANVTQNFLHHNRPIARPVDDSVTRFICGKPRLFRAGRGVAPLEFELPGKLSQPLLAVGGHMKNTIALGWERRAVLSPHIGNLNTPRSIEVFEQVIEDMQQLYDVIPQAIVCDSQRVYTSSHWAARKGLPLIRIWHHHAHAAVVAMEHSHDRTWLTFTWDGVGLGEDHKLWGGEALHGQPGSWRRVASMRPFRLPGGERAGREPWRSGLALCWETGIENQSAISDNTLLKQAWERGLNAPATSAVGRLFDGAASLLGLIEKASYEGQAAMYLENIAVGSAEAIELPLNQDTNGLLTADWRPLVKALLQVDVSVAQRAMQFHVSLAHSIVAQALRIHSQVPFDSIGLTGGVFQNKLLAELSVAQLTAAGFDVHLTERLPCNDGGIALGQLVESLYSNG